MNQIDVDMKIVGVRSASLVVVEHNLPLLYGALKTNNAKWNRLNSKIKALKTGHLTESAKKKLQNAIIQSGQTHAVIVLITNCLIEALANLYLTYKCDGEQFNTLERLSTFEKLAKAPKHFLERYEFPENELYHDLRQLLALRKSLVHPKPRVLVNGQKTHKGNLAKKEQVSMLNPEKCVSLPARVVAHIWNYDHGALAEIWINSEFSDSVIREDFNAKARLKQRGKN
ncbi:MAG: hypothetical protein ACREFE_10260 [Limisphaerales bacterium]